ncbi:Zn(II)2Cys6 transcription factor [Aspergillus foveolatus]|uniref:Zn(II)2Cys6 transcription factor n=1 Tax=Aspergillus foveolatus TaxID=210207 RepID=UPI003CCCE7EF
MNPSRGTITKKACDGCKVRKIRCGGGNPCTPCLNARIHRPLTLTQARRSVPLSAIAPLLYIYHVRMYPVWPIVDVDDLIANLQQDTENKTHERFALATSIAAATMAQLRLGGSAYDRSVTADILAAECLEARRRFDYRSRVNLDNVRTAFFLHVYYENQQPGGSESVLYLREAITMAQMMYLHREASYASLAAEEQKVRRRVLWLLFVTERGVCILHKLPVILKTDTAMPETDADDEVLPAFLKLLALFRLFEQTRMFDIVEDYHLGLEPPVSSSAATAATFDEMFQDKSPDGFGTLDRVSDVQRADICVTRHWMRILAWKALSHSSTGRQPASECSLSPIFPLMVGRDLVSVVYRLPRVALQAHGLGMQLKLYEIATSLADAVTSTATVPDTSRWDQESRPSNILTRLHSILSALTGGENSTLVDILYGKIAQAHYMHSTPILPALSNGNNKPNRKSKTAKATCAEDSVTATDSSQNESNETGDAINWPSGLLTTVDQPASDDSSTTRLTSPGDYSQSSYDPLIYSTVQDLRADPSAIPTSTTSTSLDLVPLGPMFNNAIFDYRQDYLCLNTYLPLNNLSGDSQYARLNPLT